MPIEVRQSAGLLLKNLIRSHYNAITSDSRLIIKSVLITVMSHKVKALRQTAGSCIVTLICLEGLSGFPELLPVAFQALESGDIVTAEGALDTLYKIAEDQPALLETTSSDGSTPSDILIPRVLAQFNSSSSVVRSLAVGFLNLLSVYLPRALVERTDAYLQGLFTLAMDSSVDVKKNVCSALVQMLILAPDSLKPSMPQLIEYMLQSTQDGDEGVALESCEFWSAFGESQTDEEVLKPFLPRLLPVLLKNMVFDEYDEEVEEAENAEALSGGEQQDRDQDLKPHIHKGVTHDAEEEDGDDDDEEINRWNLRRCSAAGLDVLATLYHSELLAIIMPVVQARLREEDWRLRESAILALGAISEGCVEGLMPHLPGMIKMLLPSLQDPRPLVRCISCWSITRYSKWCFQRAVDGQRGELDAIVAGICASVLDHNRKVQEAACGSVATLAEEGGDLLAPYLARICAVLASALRHYGKRSMRNLYDAIATVAEHSPSLRAPDCSGVLLPPLFALFGSLTDGDRELLPLMEVLASVCPVVQDQISPYAQQAYERCLNMTARFREALHSGAYDEDEAVDFIASSLDLLSGLIDGLGAGAESLVARSTILRTLMECCLEISAEIRQSAFALVGDLAKACAPHVRPMGAEFLSAAIANLEPSMITTVTMSACNNACWSMGELFLIVGPDAIAQTALSSLERLAGILNVTVGVLPRSLKENAAITLGRLAFVAPDLVATHAEHFLGGWCTALRGVRDDIEKEQAFVGLASVLKLNPQSASNCFISLCEAILSWRQIKSTALHASLTELLHAYKQHLTSIGQWERALSNMSPAAAQKLLQTYDL